MEVVEKQVVQNKSNRTVPSFIKDNWFLIVVMLYVFMPVDFIPDVVPLLGSADDASLVLIEILRKYMVYRSGKSA